ncbi:(2E,6E)-farnesyl diphosphate synthase [Sodalis endosymbiont of Henestaris halophilus]|uniref:(2E,6E)-farnesyl diphosphate synthase n=1 Tax=Sodalis endosymbiont of Henestaris halophilus TaxID=1929246 RepID=UPI000BC08662|nr:(2E,6E)-farnesyl diphosphate synthase [Sodalis endosymbiont of Henestaris halophilus]SNC58508.1 Farnesyl diphosphate synthase [Sodalis endosymbiont of Henestaris halophilus]
MIDFMCALEDSRQRVNASLERYFHSLVAGEQAQLVQAMRYSALLGGKRLRPFLVYQTGKLFGITLASLDVPASAIECIHAYSLIHDDLPAMDNDTLRRGLPTCHVKFGETIAILAGDALHTLAFSILADADLPEILPRDRLKMISTLAAASGADGMCLGQAMDLAMEEQQMSSTHLEIIHQHKTGSLIRAAVRIGALAAGERSNSALCYLDHFATTIGLAFQVQDDILDVVGDSQITGKWQGKDYKLSKSTYPSLLGLDMACTKAHDLYKEALTSLECVAELGYNTTTLVALARYVIERKK